MKIEYTEEMRKFDEKVSKLNYGESLTRKELNELVELYKNTFDKAIDNGFGKKGEVFYYVHDDHGGTVLGELYESIERFENFAQEGYEDSTEEKRFFADLKPLVEYLNTRI